MILFHNDYNETCHPAVMQKINQTMKQQMSGYGRDEYCGRAAQLIREKCGRDDLAVHFLVGGTQTNLTVIVAALRPHHAVIAAETGHISVHETGAIEATGHKVILLQENEGKITSEQVEQTVLRNCMSPDAEFRAQPKLVYISNPTELGTTYSLDELEELSAVCKKYQLYLFVDGARLGYALSSAEYDVTLADLARLTDAFYIGGTKVGTMFGEAVVIANGEIANEFRYLMKQRGGLLAKGWLIGAQFEALFENNLYFTISKQADEYADRLREQLQFLGYQLLAPNKTNQVFVVLPNVLLEILEKDFTFENWECYDEDYTLVRFCTSWATASEHVDALCNRLQELTDEMRR